MPDLRSTKWNSTTIEFHRPPILRLKMTAVSHPRRHFPPTPTSEHPMRDASRPVEHVSLRSAKILSRKTSGATRQEKTPFCMRISDPQTDMAPGRTRGRNVRSKNKCSMCPAIHTKSRSWLRSSSTREPSDPLLRVVICFSILRRSGFLPRTECF